MGSIGKSGEGTAAGIYDLRRLQLKRYAELE